jgi:hypothetical protein
LILISINLDGEKKEVMTRSIKNIFSKALEEFCTIVKKYTLDIPTIQTSQTMHIFPTNISEYIQSHSVSELIHHSFKKK